MAKERDFKREEEWTSPKEKSFFKGKKKGDTFKKSEKFKDNKFNKSSFKSDKKEFKPRDVEKRPVKAGFNTRDESKRTDKPRGERKRRDEQGFKPRRTDKSEFVPRRSENANERPRIRPRTSESRTEFKPKIGKTESDKFGFKPKKSGFRVEGKEYNSKDNDNYKKQEKSIKKGFSMGFGERVKTDKNPSSFYEKELKDKLPQKISKKIAEKDDLIRLNKYISNAGICSRREADALIEAGQITVNGKPVTEMGYKVKENDVVKYGRKILNIEKLVYVLLNKPKDFLTTTDDPQERQTVMDLVEGVGKERIYPVGRLDRLATGLLLLTNDGELADRLSSPSNKIKKIYEVSLDRTFTKEDFEKLKEGLMLENGQIKAHDLAILNDDATKIGIEIHSGKNSDVREVFENLGYEVKKLDRTMYAGLNKKELPKGKWRHLSEKEIIRLKYLI